MSEDGLLSTPDENAARRERVQAAFERASRVVPPDASILRLCGRSARLRVAGEVLAAHVLAPLAHLRIDDEREAPHLSIDLWDARETGVPGPAPELRHATGGQHWMLPDGSFAVSGDGRFVSHELRGSRFWLDRSAGRLTGWFEDGSRLSLHERGKPLQTMLAVWSSDLGMQPVHAALVARAGHGVLVPGAGGSGKSTVSLACLEAGYGYVGDDWIALDGEGEDGITGHGLYASAFLEPNHAARFPRLARCAIPAVPPEGPKSLVLLARDHPGGLLASAPIVVLALPRVVRQRTSSFRPASKRDAMLMLAPSSVLAMRPRSGREGVERLARFVDQVPAYWLEIGAEIADIPRCLDDLLAERRASERP